ncbi:terminase [Saccharopolyspora erythraea]|uniref:hypothetical protein n=1 Tax=Saccharopolyspora erythraea TaxID=1836 RepID=UPI001BA924E6|nr:hypothetical protein [Saccharopolyspora erythraea]QUH01461.1 terminase [Saccharopolyspora erythraea]
MVRIKGASKSGMAAMLSMVEFVGPCRPARDEAGNLIAVPHPKPLIQIAAVNYEQTNNTFAYFGGLITEAVKEQYGITLGKEIAYSEAGGKLMAVSSNYRALEGARPSFAVLEETHLWVEGSTQGPKMFEVISRNLAKSPDGSARSLQVSNQFDPSENSVLQATWEAYQAIQTGRSKASGVLYDSIEAPPDIDITDPDQLRAGINAAKGDAFWLDVDRVMQEVLNTRIPVSISRRFWLNQQTASEDSFVSPQEWGALAVAGRTLKPGDPITLGLDASVSDDHTALVACHEDGFLQLLWRWAPDPRDPDARLPREELDEAVRHAFATYKVQAFFADPSFIEAHVLAWNADFGRVLRVKATGRDPIGFDLRGKKQDFTRAVELFQDAVVNGHVSHGADPQLSWYVLNGRRVANRYGYSVAKVTPDSSRKIDALISAILAYRAWAEIKSSTKGRLVRRGAIRLPR